MLLGREYFNYAIPIGNRLTNITDLNVLLSHLVKLKASDMFLTGEDYVWAKRNSELVRITTRILSTKEVTDLLVAFNGVNSITQLGTGKDAIDTDLELKEPTEDARFSIRHRFRVNATNTKMHGRLTPDITIRTISAQPAVSKEIGVPEELSDLVRSATKGMFLMVGATGSGKTTTLSALVRDILEDNKSHKKVISIEKPIEFVFDDVPKPTCIYRPFEVGKCVESFSKGTYNALRQAADVIYVGEIREEEAILQSIEASNTGHFVISTLHSNDVAGTIPRLLSGIKEELQQAAKLSLIHGMRGVCAQCLCPAVNGGRVAIREWLIFEPFMRDILLKSTDLSVTMKELVLKYGRSMYKSALEKYEQGIISKESLKSIEANYGKD